MRERIREARENESGFTLIELLIVIIVLGILAAIVVFGVANFRRDAAQSACSTSFGTQQAAAAAYNSKYGFYPSVVNSLMGAGTLNYLVTTPDPLRPMVSYQSLSLPIISANSLVSDVAACAN